MFSLLMTVKSIALVEQIMDFTRAGKEYLNEHRAILSVDKYEIPSLIWPPPLFVTDNCALYDLLALLIRGASNE